MYSMRRLHLSWSQITLITFLRPPIINLITNLLKFHCWWEKNLNTKLQELWGNFMLVVINQFMKNFQYWIAVLNIIAYEEYEYHSMQELLNIDLAIQSLIYNWLYVFGTNQISVGCCIFMYVENNLNGAQLTSSEIVNAFKIFLASYNDQSSYEKNNNNKNKLKLKSS